MISEINKILIVQTAFAGDVILTLPLAQVLSQRYPLALIDMVVIPRTAELLSNHPAINEAVIFDKQGKDSGIRGLMRQIKIIRKKNYDIAFIPHRSMRSAVLVKFTGIKHRIGFDKSGWRFLFNNVIHYDTFTHEIERNLSLLMPFGIDHTEKELPQLFPAFHDRKKVGLFLSDHGIQHVNSLISVAPGTVWNTKQWLKERFIELIDKLTANGFHIILIGGDADAELCKQINNSVSSKHVYSAAGKLTLLQSAELIRRCKLLIANDSAPVHLAVAMKTPVVAIFGATAPEFGFAPYGKDDVVVEIKNLTCRPCSIHGGPKCPIKTFDCMKRITAEDVFKNVISRLTK
ncbi:MAG: putative lipopolysaccharide heptosyltransferase III [Bacteroidota bacterium]|nr:putative lipopolysaccharide heptosyltransferase III [Bacteroidota bacterium]